MADAIFVGGAPVVKQISTGTVAGTPATGNTFTVTCNSKSLVVTIPATGITTDQVAAEIANSVMANSPTDPAPATGYTRNVGGREIPEFRDFEAYSSGSVVYFRSLSSIGQPFTITLSESGGATTFTLATPTAATGPCHLDDAANYRLGALPADGDTFSAEGDVDILWGLDYLAVNTLSTHLDLDLSLFGGQIGLSETNPGGYDEYRNLPGLRLYSENGAEKRINIFRSQENTRNSTKRLGIWPGTNHSTVTVAAGRGMPDAPNIVFTSGTIVDGVCNFAEGNIEIRDGNTWEFASHVYLGREGGNLNDCRTHITTSCDLSDAENLWSHSGQHRIDCETVYSGGGTGTFRVYGGIVDLGYTGTLALNHRANIEVFSGGTLTVSQRGGTTGTCVITAYSGGTVDFRKSMVHQTFTRIALYAGSAIYDAKGLSGTVNSVCVYDLVGCRWSDLAVAQVPSNLRFTTAVIS